MTEITPIKVLTNFQLQTLGIDLTEFYQFIPKKKHDCIGRASIYIDSEELEYWQGTDEATETIKQTIARILEELTILDCAGILIKKIVWIKKDLTF